MEHKDIAEGIIFKISDSNSSDKLISIITQEGDKVVLLAKHIKSPNSKRSQAIELGNRVKAKFLPGYNVNILTDIKVVDEHIEWKREYQKMFFLQLICEIINNFSYENNSEKQIFDALDATLKCQTSRIEFSIAVMVLRILEITGLLPDLDKDMNTSEKLISDNVYIAQGVGYVSDIKASYHAQKIPERIYKTQRYILENNNLDQCLRVTLNLEEDKALLKLHLDWLEASIDKKLKTKEIISQLFR